MSLRNEIIGHLFRQIYLCNPLLNPNRVFLFNNFAETSQRALENELNALEARLETEMDLVERAKIKEEMRKIEDQMNRLEVVSAPLNTLLLNGLQNNIDDINASLNTEQDLIKREELEAKRLNCINALTARQAPVANIEELNDAVDQIEGDQRLLDSLASGKLDEVDLHLFLNSGMIPFIDSRFEGAINIAFEQMFVNDNVQSALGKAPEENFVKADANWIKFKEDNEKAIQEMEKEKEQTKSNSRRKELESQIQRIKAQNEKGRSSWTHRERTRLEKASASRSVLDSVSPDTLNKLKQLLTEAQGIRAERVREYLAREFSKLEDQLKAVKTKKIFSKKTLEKLEAKLTEARGIIVDQKQSDPKNLRKLADNFQSAKVSLSTSAEEVEDARKNRPQLEAQIASDYARFQSALAGLTPGKIEEITKQYRTQAAATSITEDSVAFKKAMNALHQLGNPDSEIHTKMRKFSQSLANISEMDPEEILAISQDLNLLKPRLDFLENLDANLAEALSPENHDAKLAHKTIQDLEKAKNPDEIRKILETNFGAEYLEFISHYEFEKTHRPFTKTGHMVFHEQGSKWKIIIDESVFKNAKNLDVLKKQLTHELLHLEFERSDRVKSQVREALVKGNPKKWQQIKEAFIDMAKEKKKKQPHGEVWEDDDILSELYAMQNEMGQVWSKGNSPTERLNNLLVGAGVATAIGNIAEKTRGYQKGAKELVRGYEEGVEAGENTRDPGESVTDVATVTKEQAVYKDNKEKIDALSERMKELQKSEFLNQVPGAGELVDAMSSYNDGTAELNEDLRKEPESEVFAVAITERINKVNKDFNDVEDQVGKAARKAPNTEIGLFRKLWISTTFLSVQDFVQMGTDVYEFLERRNKRKVADNAARLGMALFSGTDLGREAHARKQKAESEEVNEWKSRYENNMDAWELMAEMRDIAHSLLPNRDQFKAIIRILADKGHLNWRNEDLWTILNKLQSSVVLKPGDQLLLHNPILLRQRLNTALGEIYDYDEFTTLEKTNEGAYQSGKGKYDTLHSRMQDQLNGRLDELLEQHRAGEHIEPMLYESILEYAIKNGKCYAENVMFHLMAGMAEGLLPPDRGLAMGDHLNEWPAVDWFTTMRPPMSTADWKRFCLQKFPKSFMKGSISVKGFGDDFQNWFWTDVQNCPKVIERVKKSVGARGWDHDWGRSIAPLGDATTAKRFLAGRSGQEETQVTAISNAYVGAIQWLEENAKNPQAANKKNFARMAGWIAMSEGILDGTAYKEPSKDINTRANEAMNNDIPRESGIGRHGGESLRVHRDLASEFLKRLDPQFFTMIAKREARTDEVKRELGGAARDYLVQRYPSLAEALADVEIIDQIYDRIDLIISTMFDQMSEAQFQAILSQTAP